jgi:hypothetical protein
MGVELHCLQKLLLYDQLRSEGAHRVVNELNRASIFALVCLARDSRRLRGGTLLTVHTVASNVGRLLRYVDPLGNHGGYIRSVVSQFVHEDLFGVLVIILLSITSQSERTSTPQLDFSVAP